MGKLLFAGEEDGIAFPITSIENKYGHFKDYLTLYISIIEESQARMSKLYNDMDAKQKEVLSMFPQPRMGASGERKYFKIHTTAIARLEALSDTS